MLPTTPKNPSARTPRFTLQARNVATSPRGILTFDLYLPLYAADGDHTGLVGRVAYVPECEEGVAEVRVTSQLAEDSLLWRIFDPAVTKLLVQNGAHLYGAEWSYYCHRWGVTEPMRYPGDREAVDRAEGKPARVVA